MPSIEAVARLDDDEAHAITAALNGAQDEKVLAAVRVQLRGNRDELRKLVATRTLDAGTGRTLRDGLAGRAEVLERLDGGAVAEDLARQARHAVGLLDELLGQLAGRAGGEGH